MLVMYPDFDACTLITVPFFSFFLSLTVNFPFLFAFTVYFFEPTVTVTFDFLRDVPLITFFPFLYEVRAGAVSFFAAESEAFESVAEVCPLELLFCAAFAVGAGVAFDGEADMAVPFNDMLLMAASPPVVSSDSFPPDIVCVPAAMILMYIIERLDAADGIPKLCS